jgi:hypothetical protein
VECLALDDFMAESDLDRLDFIKLDAEGAEIHIVTGAIETIGRHHPRLLTEFNPACMKEYFGQDSREYFELLRSIYPQISVIESAGTLTPLFTYASLAERIETGKGWEDLFCSFA